MMVTTIVYILWFHLLSTSFLKLCGSEDQSQNCHIEKINCYICTGIPNWYLNNTELQDNVNHITHLEIKMLQLDVLDIERLTYNFTNVSNLTVFNGNISSLQGRFRSENNITVLILRNLLIQTISSDCFENLNFLEYLDLTGNHLSALEDFHIAFILKHIPGLRLSRNHWNCTSDLKWILHLNTSTDSDIKEMKCYGYPYPGKPLYAIAEFKQNIRSNCPNQCECTMPDVVRDPSTQLLEPIIEVNCSNKNLTNFPSNIPAKTKILVLEWNQITSMQSLVTVPVYKDVLDLYLDHNLIENIDDLEGTYWLTHFRVVSLTNNKLSQLPTYAIDNALEQNPNMPEAVAIYLGNNPWKCDCNFIPGFQEMLRKYEMQIKDKENIKCSFVEGDDNSLAAILELTRNSICHLPADYSVQALDFLNGILASLLAFIIGKLLYDYYYFKKTGKLPWIITKNALVF